MFNNHWDMSLTLSSDIIDVFGNPTLNPPKLTLLLPSSLNMQLKHLSWSIWDKVFYRLATLDLIPALQNFNQIPLVLVLGMWHIPKTIYWIFTHTLCKYLKKESLISKIVNILMLILQQTMLIFQITRLSSTQEWLNTSHLLVFVTREYLQFF